MKTGLLILGAAVLASIAWWLASPADQPEKPDRSAKASKTNPEPSNTLTDPVAVFQKAFWKRPAPEDHILRAERKEWADPNGISKWQWSLSVKPSAALVEYLITQNAFMLRRSEPPAKLPEGFPSSAKGYEAYTNASATFLILWDPQQNLLHATDSGSGFRPGAPEPVKAAVTPQPDGRLPTTPPPNPQ